MPHEGAPSPEVELTVTLEEARQEVGAIIESVIFASLDKAQKLSVDGIDDIADLIRQQMEIPDDIADKLSQKRGQKLLVAIQNLRVRKGILMSGIRGDATNEELIQLVDQLQGFNEKWKAYVGDPELIKDARSLVAVIGNTAFGLQRKVMVIKDKDKKDKSILSVEANQQLDKIHRESLIE